MTGRVRSVSTHRHSLLDARWSLCATMPGAAATPAELDAAGPEWLPISAPDTVAGALRQRGLWSLDAPGRNFDAEDWWFRALFEAPRQGAARRSLRFGGLAGECRLWLNGVPLLASDNMHVARDCAAPDFVEGENELLMRFASLDARAVPRNPRPRWRAPMIAQPKLRWARASLLGRTPGWSPSAPVIGPWRAIEWIESDGIEFSDLRLRSELDGDIGHVALSVGLAPLIDGGIVDTVTLRVGRDGRWHEIAATPGNAPAHAYAARLAIPDVQRWWPHTHGAPALYDACLVVKLLGDPAPVHVDLGRLGFRTLAVDRGDGGFALRVNGTPIFCRGANWTPLDVVSPAVPAGATHAALAQVRDAGLNMVRVNGCMVYEDDAFFESCDALGLLIWQDFMFANMDYPAGNAEFAASVRDEARQQLGRWQGHPSLALICGNSEAEQQAAMWGAPREAWTQPLFDEDLAALAREYCPDVPYWPSSAHGGAFPHQADVGTTSYYGVGAYLRPLEDARRSGLRFASECLAFANIPSLETLARMPGGSGLRSPQPGWKSRVPRDLGAGWDFEDVRDHYLQRLYGIDPVALRSTDPERYLQLGRAVSAEVIQATVSEWRRPASICRGALVWFLRDLQAGPGWGLLDDQGVPKAAFHGLRRASAPIHLFMTDEGLNGLALHIVNDPSVSLVGSVEVALYRDDGLCLRSATRDVSVPGHGGRSWGVCEWFGEFIDLTRAYRFGPAEHALVAATLRDPSGRLLDRAFFFPEGLTASRRHDVGLSIRVEDAQPERGVIVSVAARTTAQCVYFDAEGYVAQDEYFHLAPGEARAVALVPVAGAGRPGTHASVSALNAWSGAAIEIAA